MQNDIAEIKLRAERRAGELLGEREKNNGTRMAGKDNIGSPIVQPPNDASTLEDIGISKSQSSHWIEKVDSLAEYEAVSKRWELDPKVKELLAEAHEWLTDIENHEYAVIYPA